MDTNDYSIRARGRVVARNVVAGTLRMGCAGVFIFLFLAPYVFGVFKAPPGPLTTAAVHWKTWLPATGVIAFAWLCIYEWLRFRRCFYGLDETGLTVRTGVIARKVVTVPFSGITCVRVERDPLDVLFGLYDVHVCGPAKETEAGPRVEGVDSKGADGLLDLFIARLGQAGGGPSAGDEDTAKGEDAMELARRNGAHIAKNTISTLLRLIAMGLALAIFASPFALRVLGSLPASTIKDTPRILLGAAVVGGALLCLLPLYYWLRSRRDSYLLGGGCLTVSRGFLATRKTVIPLAFVAEVTTERGLLDLLFGLHNAQVRCAGGTAPAVRLEGFSRDGCATLRDAIFTGQRRGLSRTSVGPASGSAPGVRAVR